MRIKILKIDKSDKSIWDTKLSIKGVISNETASSEQAYEMKVEFYDSENSTIPSKSIVINDQHHSNNIAKYGMEALLKGVSLNSMLSITEKLPLNEEDLRKEIEAIAYGIVSRVGRDMLLNNYNPNKLREYIEDKIMSLKDKFRIESK